MNKKYFLFILGCQMNHSDAERLKTLLGDLGFIETLQEEEADTIGVVACSVRQAAIDRIWGKSRAWRKKRKAGKNLQLFLTGCVLPEDRKKMSEVFDLVFDINESEKLLEFFGENKKRLEEYKDYLAITPAYGDRFRAFVPIMTGCNNFCAYCAVPYVRGRERSRQFIDVINEVKNLAAQGCLEVTLLGQNVNSYHPADKNNLTKDNPFTHSLAALLYEINQIEGIERIHFTAAHPKDMHEDVITALSLPKQANYLHLPLQSGDDTILEKMNRHYTHQDYLNIIRRVREVRPDIAIGTDLIVGFPGETEDQFNNTLEVYEQANFDISYNAVYSAREGTVAARDFADDVPLAEKRQRWRKLQAVMEEVTEKINKKYVGQTVSVLVDKCSNGKCSGQSLEFKLVEFPSEENLVGKIVEVRITEAKVWVLRGILL